jgi:hypothetical protein
LDGVKRYVEALNARAAQDGRDRPDRQFIKNPSGWLNGERWLDEPASAHVIDQAGNCVTARQVNGHRLSAGSASSERKRQILREAGMLS